ncbi:MAG: ABC transporter ATP-binding protein [bacterium]
MSGKAASIEVRGVSKRFGAVVALDNVTFDVHAGELFFLLGPSGCGKTTMLRILAGLENPDSGKICFNGTDIAALPPHRRGAPMVFQNYALWPHLSVSENVAFGLVERRLPGAEVAVRTREALRRVGLDGLGGRMPGQLSGGQQQRVVLARALVLNPAIVLLDEPLSNLDAKLRGEMREEIEKLHRETDITFVYVTHDQTEALSLADRMAVMQGGRIRAVGAPLELYHRPPNTFCADFLGESNLLQGIIAGGTGGMVSVKTGVGTFQAVFPAAGSQPAVGCAVNCLIRPESLRCTGREGANRISATVRSMRLNGATTTVDLECNGLPLKAVLLSQYAMDIKPGVQGDWYADQSNTICIVEE